MSRCADKRVAVENSLRCWFDPALQMVEVLKKIRLLSRYGAVVVRTCRTEQGKGLPSNLTALKRLKR